MGQVFTVGVEKSVNTTQGNSQSQGHIQHLPDGGWIVVWLSQHVDGKLGAYLQRYTKEGNPQGGETLVSAGSADSYKSVPKIAPLSDGGWLVVWEQDYAINFQRYDVHGLKQGSEVTFLPSRPGQVFPKVIGLKGGGWLFTWTGSDNSGGGIQQVRFDSNGDIQTPEHQVNTTTADEQVDSSVTRLKDDGWVVTWTSFKQDGSGYGIYQQRYDADGDPVGGETRVNTTTENDQTEASVTALSDGGWVVTWQSERSGTADQGIYQQRYNAQGQAVGGEVRVSTSVSSIAEKPYVTALANGGWVVTWEAGEIFDKRICQQAYSKEGIAQFSHELPVSSRAVDQTNAAVAALDDGDWVVIWEAQDAWGPGILQQRFELNVSPTAVSLSSSAIDELAATGSTVGILMPTDANAPLGETYQYAIVGDGAGGRFKIVGNEVQVANGMLLDHEQSGSHTIRVKITDGGGLSIERDLTITVRDVIGERADGSSGDDVFIGDKGRDILAGNAGNDTIQGGGDRDRLSGGYGNDVLTGGAEKDIFVFNAKLGTAKTDRKVNFDTITDFNVKDDTIWLDNKAFKKLGKKGSEDKPVKLKKDFFTIGTKAKDANDYLIYNKKKGVLYYDQDGSGSKKAIEIAKLDKKLKLTYKDFFVI